jgi:hypothetical protein
MWDTAMTERRKLLLDRLSSFVLEVLPWSLSGLIGLYLLSSYVLLPVRAEGTRVGEYGNPFTHPNLSIRPKDAPPQRHAIPGRA